MGILRNLLGVGLSTLVIGWAGDNLGSIDEAVAQSRSTRASLEKRNARASGRREILGPNQALVGVKLPPPWDQRIPKPGDPDFAAAQDAAWEVLSSAVTPLLYRYSPVKLGCVPANSVENFYYAPNVFRIVIEARCLPTLRDSSGITFVSSDPGVVTAKPNRPLSQDIFFHPSQIALENDGNTYIDIDGLTRATVRDVDIDMWETWRYTIGKETVVIAVIDDAFDISKPELRGQVYTNTHEIPCNGIDDDSNGFIDDYRGYDAVRRTGCHTSGRAQENRFKAEAPNSPAQHGTAMLLTMASLPPRLGDSSAAGVAPGVRLLPIAYQGSLDHAFEYVVASKRSGVPIRVVNLSLGTAAPGPWECSPLRKGSNTLTPLGQLLASDVSIIAAAGNEGSDNDRNFVCPAGLAKRYDNVVSVAAVDPRGQHPFYSNFGATSVTISAPGTAIYTGYGYQTGTSPATALVSGVAALMYTARPELTPAEVKKILIETAKLKDLNLPTQSKGMLSALSALKAVWSGRQPGPGLKKPPL